MDYDTNLLSSHNAAAAFSLQDAADMSKQKCYGFGFLKQDRAINEEDLREFKMAKTSYFGRRSNGSSLSDEGCQQMLSFSSPTSHPATLPYYHYASNSNPFGGSMEGLRGPFTPSQWMELEHQALIYKYITANVPIPSYLLNPIRKAFDSAGFSVLRSNPLGWGGYQLGFSNTDPEPGRCRRTDGKKWRCSRDAVVDQKYCERHMNRGRHRSRKPVETQPTPSIAKPTSNNQVSTSPAATSVASNKHNAASIQEFGLVCSDSLLNPLNRTEPNHELRQFMDEWPNANQSDRVDLQPERTQLSISIPTTTSDFMSSTSSPTNGASPPRELKMGLGVGPLDVDRNQSQIPISWEPTSIGGPLGEALHNTSNGIGNAKQLNLIERWDNGPRLASSPTGVLQRGAFVSLSNSE